MTVGIDYDLSWFPFVGFGDSSGKDYFEMRFGFRNIDEVWTLKISGMYYKSIWKDLSGFFSVESFLTTGGENELFSLKVSERDFIYTLGLGISYEINFWNMGIGLSGGESFVLPFGASSDLILAPYLGLSLR